MSYINVQVEGPAKKIEPLKEIPLDADFYKAISGFLFYIYLGIQNKLIFP